MTIDKMTLVLLLPGFPKDEGDTTCLPFQQSFVRKLHERYPHIELVIFSLQYPYSKEKYQWYGIQVVPFGGRNRGGFMKLVQRRKILKELEAYKRISKPMALLSFWYGECAWIGHQFATKYQLSHFCWIMGQDAKSANSYPRKLGLAGGELIALSNFLELEFLKNHGVRPENIVPAGINAPVFQNDISIREIDIIGVGSLIPLKQYEIFISTIAAIRTYLPFVKAILIGEGTERHRLEALIRDYKLQTNIELKGELPYDAVLACMSTAKIFLHPSGYEGFSGVCLEALQAGCHVISFCKPMEYDIDQWQIVRSTEEMEQATQKLLGSAETKFQSVIVFEVEEIVKRIIGLYSIRAASQ